jgi:hypothetical protein
MSLWIAIALALSVFLIAVANLSVRRPGWWSLLFVAAGIGFSILPGYFLPLALLFALLFIAHVVCYYKPVRRFFLIASVVVAALPLGLTGWLLSLEYEKFAELRTEYPFESLEGRIPPQPARHAELTGESEQRLAHQEDLLDSRVATYRRTQLKRVHENHIELFINRPGFGWERMSEIPHRGDIRTRDRKEYISYENPAESEWALNAHKGKDLFALHQAGLFDFVNPSGFGFIKDREHVAGFQSHQFYRELYRPVLGHEVQSIELIGLLLHEKPAVYVSDELPRMDRLRQAPTRPLNEFEASALDKLRKGEDLVVEPSSSKSRMVGSLRNAKQCMECHGGHRGDLLGAFSYKLR